MWESCLRDHQFFIGLLFPSSSSVCSVFPCRLNLIFFSPSPLPTFISFFVYVGRVCTPVSISVRKIKIIFCLRRFILIYLLLNIQVQWIKGRENKKQFIMWYQINLSSQVSRYNFLCQDMFLILFSSSLLVYFFPMNL